MVAPVLRCSNSAGLVSSESVRIGIAAILFCGLASTQVQAERRVALVIGNSAYQHSPKLTNPKTDAADMAAVLMQLGFDVMEGRDLTKAAMDRKVRDFGTALAGADVGVLFYAGHGLQVAGQNYLVPIDAELASEAALDFETVRLDLVQRTMERETKTNILFFDACRDNPLVRNLARAMGTRSNAIGRGLATTQAGVGTLISFSTQPDNVALDGPGRNSPFAEALVKRIRSAASSEDLSRLLINVRNDVWTATKHRQVPWEHSALFRPFYFLEELKKDQDSAQTPRPTPLESKAPAGAIHSQPPKLQIKSKDDGSFTYRLSEVKDVEQILPAAGDCGTLGHAYAARLPSDAGRDNTRFWVRIGPGDIGYCQRAGTSKWHVEYYNRDLQEGLVILHPK